MTVLPDRVRKYSVGDILLILSRIKMYRMEKGENERNNLKSERSCSISENYLDILRKKA